MQIFKAFTFDAAHKLPNLPTTHKCSQLHGHTFRVEVYVDSELDEKYGWVMDFGDIKEFVTPLIEELDHNYLNSIEGLENPTSENICKWLWKRIQPDLSILTKIVVQESPDSASICTGKDL